MRGRKERPSIPTFEQAVFGAFTYFNSTERGMTEQAFFDAFRPFGWKHEYITSELESLVQKEILSVEDHPEYGKIYRPSERSNMSQRRRFN